MSVFEELKRRNVFRVAIAYLIAAWLVLQVSELVLDAIEAPAWVLKVFLLIFALGFPITILFSWAYELTPEGIKREKDVDRDQSVTQSTGRKLNQITIAMVIALIALVGVDRLTAPYSIQPANDAAAVTTGADIDDKSIAVLAFEDLSPQGDQEYFADGLSEELLNVLAQTPGLQVAGRTSSFAFKGQNRDLREIGEILNVAHILEGSVRKSGNKIRVTAQLINAQNGFHLFSQTYDRDLTDVFAVQDEISASISNALKAELIGTQAVQVAETSIEAYDLYLVARQKIYTRDKDEMMEASRLLDEAISIDSEYAPALAQKALVLQLLSDSVGSYGEIPQAESYALSRPLVDKALLIDPNLAEAHAVLGLIMDLDPGASVPMKIASLEHALELNPNMDNARNWLARVYGRAGRRAEGRALLESVVERDPLFGPAFNNLIQSYIRSEDYDLANALIGRVERITGETDDVQQAWGSVAYTQGETAQAIRLLRKVYEKYPSDTVVLLWYSWSLSDLGEYETIAEIGLPNAKVSALDALGRFDEAKEKLDLFSPVTDNAAPLETAARHFMNSRNCEGIVPYIEQHFNDLDAALLRLKQPDGNNAGHLAPLAYCYLQIGDEQQFAKLIDALEESVQQRASNGSTFIPALYEAAELAALTGQEDEVISFAKKIVDKNGVGVDFFGAAIFDQYRDHAEMQNVNATMLKRANDERAKLGLEPYRAPMASN
jgi:TolB-like protein